MPKIIPVQAVPSQTVSTIVGGQVVKLEIAQKRSFDFVDTKGMYVNVYRNDVLIIGGVICEHANLIVRDTYLGFQGDLMFVDSTGNNTDPVYSDLGSTHFLVYLEPELVANIPLSAPEE